MPLEVGSKRVDGYLKDWTGVRPLYTHSGYGSYALYGETWADGTIFAISRTAPIGANTTIWLDTDLDRSTGHQIWGFTGGAEYNIQIAADGSAALYSGAGGQTFIADLEVQYGPDNLTMEVAFPASVLDLQSAFRVYADVNDQVFLPGDYSNEDLIVQPSGQAPPPPVAAGAMTLDGDLSDWFGPDGADTALLYGDGAGAALRGTVSGDYAVFALSGAVPIGQGTTIWLDTDLDRTTGYQIWGVTGGVEYNIEFAADGTAALYSGGAGQTFVAQLDVRYAPDGTIAEVAVPLALAGIKDAVRVFADINNSIFLPGDYANIDLIAGDLPAGPGPFDFGSYTIDGVLNEYATDTLLYTTPDGAAQLFGDVIAEGLVIGLSANLAIGAATTLWLDTDLNQSTGYQIWGFAGGAEYNIEIAADGSAALYTGGAGEVFVTDLGIRYSSDGSVAEIALGRDVAALGDQVRVLADLNNSLFLPGDYINDVLIAGGPDAPPSAPDLRVGIVYSKTTAANYFDLTNYGQLVMSAQNQAMQAGIPFDLLGEADLTDAALLAQYDVLVFPAFSHVPIAQLRAIVSALQLAGEAGTGIIAAGNFMTNDETGAPLAGNSYAQMKSLLGVTLDGYGTTQGIDIVASGGSNPILDDYAPGAAVDSYETLTSFLHFRDTTGTGEVLFDQVINNNGQSSAQAAVIATQVGGNRNVHFATDAVIGNANILHEAIDWVAKDDASTADISLQMSRNTSIFYSRNDMDQSQEYYDVALQQPSIYERLNAILTDWHERYDFVGSYYINIGANPPDQQTDWAISTPYYQELLAMGNEIGTHSYTHPEDTNLLQADTPELLALLERIDPRNPNSLDPWELSQADQALLAASYRFQFETSALEIQERLGITVTGAAVPGAPEKLDTSLEIIRFFDYISGGYAGEGAGYPGAFGYLTPDQMDAVYLAPNMSFDFSLIEFQGRTPQEAAAIWAAEFDDIVSYGDTPIIAFPWHDYGPTEWSFDGQKSRYTLEMFDNFLAYAHASGTEFVTGQDLAERIATFQASVLTLSRTDDVITADVVSGDAAGHFALDVGAPIVSVADWYAWDGTQVFLAQGGGVFDITIGGPAQDVTRLSALPDRAELVSLTGDGRDLSAVIDGGGAVSVNLGPDIGTDIVLIQGAAGVTAVTDTGLDLVLGKGLNTLSVAYVTGDTPGTTASEIMIAGAGDDILFGQGGADVMFGGAGRDTFVIELNSAGTVIMDFDPKADSFVLNWSPSSDASPWNKEKEVMKSFVDYDGGTQLTYGDTFLIDLVGISRSELDKNSFQFGDTFFAS